MRKRNEAIAVESPNNPEEFRLDAWVDRGVQVVTVVHKESARVVMLRTWPVSFPASDEAKAAT